MAHEQARRNSVCPPTETRPKTKKKSRIHSTKQPASQPARETAARNVQACLVGIDGQPTKRLRRESPKKAPAWQVASGDDYSALFDRRPLKCTPQLCFFFSPSLPASQSPKEKEKRQKKASLCPGRAHGWAPRHTAPAFRSAQAGRPGTSTQALRHSRTARPVFPADGLPRHSVLLDLPHSRKPAVSAHVPPSVWGIWAKHLTVWFLFCFFRLLLVAN